MVRASRVDSGDADLLRGLAAAAGVPASGGWVRVPCPFCPAINGKAHGETMGLGTGGKAHCFRCGFEGWVPGLWGGTFDDVPDDDDEEEEAPDVGPPDGFLELADGPGSSARVTRSARAYLRGRGVTRQQARDAGIGAVTRGYYGGRVVVPVLDTDGTWAGWVARDYTGEAEKPYLYPKGMRRVLYRAALLEQETDEPALIVEGVFDAIAFPGQGVAVLGKPTREHIEGPMARSRRPLAVVLDRDAMQEAWALALRLRLLGVRAGWVELPSRADPDEVDRAWLLEAARACIE